MQKHKLKVLFGAIWLPLYVLLGISWLLAPALAHEHYGALRLISNEEVADAGLWFRMADITAAALLLGAIRLFRVDRRLGWFGKALLVVALLSAIDGVFPDTCYVGHAVCSAPAVGMSLVHDAESLLLGGLVAVLSVVDALRRRRAISIGFVGLQLVAATVIVTGLGSKQFNVVVQYVYETALIIWLGGLVDYYNLFASVLGRKRLVRRFVGLWVAAGGVFALVTAMPHVHFITAWAGRERAPLGVLLEQHSIITGVLMLYVARHLLRGERPALWLAAALFYLQIIKYSLLTPQPVGVVAYAVLLALLIYARHCFDRNTQPVSWLSRAGDIAMVLGGLAAAFLVLYGVITLTGQRSRFVRDVQHMYGRPLRAFDKQESRLSERREARLRTLSQTLAVSLGVISLWSLFRPKAFLLGSANHYSPGAFADLLGRYSASSEDYFKLWPADKAYYRMPGVDGAIAYRVEGGVAFMLADPIGPGAVERQKLLQAFAGFVRGNGWVLCALMVNDTSRDMYEQMGLQTRQIGSSAVIDVARFNTETAVSKWWRWQRNRAARSGWQYHKLAPPHSAQTMQALRAVSDAWLEQGGKTEQGFALGYFDEAYLQHCAVHVLQDESGQIVAFANELPVFGGVARASVDLIRHLPSADGAMPALLMHVIAELEGTRFRSFDLGFVPLARLDSELARLVRRMGRNRFSAAGLEQFKNKFEPDWQPNYIAYDGDLIDLARIAVGLERVLKVGPHSKKKVQ